MRVEIHVWPEAEAAFFEENIPFGKPLGTLEISGDQIASLSDRFDVMLRTLDGVKMMIVAPLGRGFGQR